MFSDAPTDPAPPRAAPRGRTVRSPETWALARRDYLDGDSAEQVCDRYGLNLSTFNDHARRDGWRKCDQPDPPPASDDHPDEDGPVDCAALAGDALVQVRRALRKGRAGEAASWMRLHEKLLARQEADDARARRRAQVAQTRGSDAAETALAEALKPLHARLAFINDLGAAHVRLGRAWSQGHISTDIYDQFNVLHGEVADAFEDHLAADPHLTHPEISAAPDP